MYEGIALLSGLEVLLCLLKCCDWVLGSEDDDDNDNKSDKSDDNNDEEAKVKDQAEEGATPPPEGGDPQPKSELQQEEEQQQQQKKKNKKQSRQDKDAEYQARIAELLLRVEPVGLDRHHCKYWLLSGEAAELHVPSASLLLCGHTQFVA